jgi:hypothetical protein
VLSVRGRRKSPEGSRERGRRLDAGRRPPPLQLRA